MKTLLRLALLFLSVSLSAQTAVTLAPTPQIQFFDQNGKPLAFGCVFTYQSQTTNALATFTDFTGTIQNSNPVILSAGGSANIWLQAGQSYTMTVKSSGGTNCSLGTTQYIVNGIGGGGSQQTTTVIPSGGVATFSVQSQNQLFLLTLTGNVTSQPLSAVGIIPPALISFEITQDGVGSHTFAWPANVIGGAPIASAATAVSLQTFLWDGTNARAVGPATIGTGPAMSGGSLTLSGSGTAGSFVAPIFSTNSALPALSGIFRMASGDAIAWRNNGNTVDDLFSKNASDNLVWPNGLSLGGGTALATTNQSGTGNLCLTTSCAETTPIINGVTFSAGAPVQGNVYVASNATTGGWGNAPSFYAAQRSTTLANTSISANTQTIVITESVTFPANPSNGTYRALVSYGMWATIGPNLCMAEAIDTTNSRAFALSGQNANGSGFIGMTGTELSSQTYAASATATFTLQINCNATATITTGAGSNALSPGESTYLSVTPVLSN